MDMRSKLTKAFEAAQTKQKQGYDLNVTDEARPNETRDSYPIKGKSADKDDNDRMPQVDTGVY